MFNRSLLSNFFGILSGQIGSRARFLSFAEDFKKMLEGEQETDSGEQVNAEACGVTLEDLKKQKLINKMQLTTLYSRLVSLMAEESVNIDDILTTLEDTEEKMLDVTQLLEDLVVMYEKNGDKQNLARTEEEIDKVAKDADKEISRVKDFLASRTKKAPIGSASSEIDFEDEKAPKPKKTYELPVSRVDRNLEWIRLPKFHGDKTKFEYFWATFESIVDETDEPAKYKMIPLKSCLEGKAEEAISKLGFSEEAYKEAKNTSKRRFGGEKKTTSELSRRCK